MGDQAAAKDPNPPPKCDHICMLDDGHVERGEYHQYGYERPSPRTTTPVPKLEPAGYLLDMIEPGTGDMHRWFCEDAEDAESQAHGWRLYQARPLYCIGTDDSAPSVGA